MLVHRLQAALPVPKDVSLCLRLFYSCQSRLARPLSSCPQEKNTLGPRSANIGRVSLSENYYPYQFMAMLPTDVLLFRSFKTKQNQARTEKIEELDNLAVEALTKKLVQEHNIPPSNSIFVRLGVLEGYLLKERTGATKGTKKFSEAFSRLITLTCIVIFFTYTITRLSGIKSIFQQGRFKSTDETGMVSDVRFNDVGGVDEAKEELADVVQFLKDPSKFTQLGAKLPKGILLVGPPGTGKTMLARAVAGEAGVPFFYAAGSEFDETFVGVGASRVRSLFENARARAPSIIFIDEIDACGSQRSNNPMQPYARQTINQLLQEMDGFQENEAPVIVLGATNAGDALDKALTRPGRFDTEVQVQLPDIKGRKDVLKIYLSKVSLSSSEEIDIDRLASLTIGMSGADLSNVVNQGALQAAKTGKTCITQEDLEFALDKIRMGPESTSRVHTEEELKTTAYHEAGHALVAYYTPAAWDIYKATIRQRGPALGHVSQIPSKEDENSMTKDKLLARLDVAMGGRVAEELLYGEEKVGTGASSDIEQATNTAYKLICDYGMSENLGLMKYHLNHVSEETKRVVDMEVKRFLELSYERTKKLLISRSQEHKLLSKALVKYETLTMHEIKLTLESNDLCAVKRYRDSLKKTLSASKQPRDPSHSSGGITLLPL